MTYQITIDNFEGPLDLLLHLIKQSEMDIYDIKIADITNQYLAYIKLQEELNLNVASSYLVMAAELIEMKSRMLLPKSEIEEEEEDPREKLIKKLIDYQNYKSLTGEFKNLEQIRKEYFTKKPSEISEFKPEGKLPDDIGLDDLMNAFNKFLEKSKLKEPLSTKITNKEYSVTERSNQIRDLIKIKKEVRFEDLFDIFNKQYIIVTFLSILNLSKNKILIIKQENNFENIVLCGV